MSILKIDLHVLRHQFYFPAAEVPFPFSYLPCTNFHRPLSDLCTPLPGMARTQRSMRRLHFRSARKEDAIGDFEEYIAEDGEVYQKTLRLVECAMFAAVSALAFLLGNSLAVEKYFACFFALPIVLSTMKWGIEAGRKTMVATTVLLFVLSGPVKSITYLLLHGFLGFAMGTFWRSEANWRTSVSFCAIVRAIGALANVVIASYLIGENILALITINVHALVTFILSSIGIIAVPSMSLAFAELRFLCVLAPSFVCYIFYKASIEGFS